jgi:Flp pilus assembly protein TadG
MMSPLTPRSRTRRETGQALVILAIAMSVVLAATAIVIDGGNAMEQQRGTQNATDAAALAGTLVIAEKLGGASRQDSDVASAMSSAFSGNASTMNTSYYIDFSRDVVGTVGRGGSIPREAYGIQAEGTRTFATLIAGVAGISTFTAGASATALAGALRSICAASDGCGVMPVTFSIPITTCDGTSRPLRMGIDWPIVGMDVAVADRGTGTYESIIPLCKNGPGGVGWLDMECGGNLRDEILDPCNTSFDIPTWLHTSSGNTNSVDSAVNTYDGQTLLIPMFDSTCRDVPSTGLPADCTDPGNGENLWYHIPRFAIFLLDRAYIQSDNNPECNSAPGQPLVGGNGGTSCFKGWFVRYVMQGRVGQVQTCHEGDDDEDQATCSEESALGVQLIR